MWRERTLSRLNYIHISIPSPSGGSTWRPHVTPTGNLPQANSPYLQTVTKTSLAHQQPDSQHIGCGYNNSARPFVSSPCPTQGNTHTQCMPGIIYKIHKLGNLKCFSGARAVTTDVLMTNDVDSCSTGRTTYLLPTPCLSQLLPPACGFSYSFISFAAGKVATG